MFLDRVKIEVSAGKGGDGCMSFRRERFVPRGGPDGGDGGSGGNVIIASKRGVDSLVALAHRKHFRAESGKHGSGANRKGGRGSDVIIEVPPGTIVVDAEADYVIKDLTGPDEQFVIARGGSAGRGNAHFKSSQNQAPRTWTPGGEGERRTIILELKVIADVGLIGKPNAGKSTLLSRLSSARPEIADYPFTTKYPNLGLVQVDLDRSFVMADIPGLIEGAHQGVGLGHDFLKHIERAGILVHLVEPAPLDQSDPIENYDTICRELCQHRAELGTRPQIVAVTKSELPGAEQVKVRLQDHAGCPVLLISAVTGHGLPQLTTRIFDQLVEQKTCT